MILKNTVKIKIKKNKFNYFLILYFIFTLSIFCLFGIFFFTSALVKSKTTKILEYVSKAGRIEYIHIFDIGYNAIKSNFYKLDKIELNIKFNDIIVIENERNKAIKNESLGIKDNLTKIDVTIKHNQEKIKAKIRLKGDRQIHFIKKKHSSYNFYLPRDKYIYGVNNFAIHKPGARNYIHEWIFNELMGDLGLIKPKYEFFELYINGSSNGLYAFEEKMAKELIERNKRRYGPIISIETEYDRSTENPIFTIYDEKFWEKPENIALAKIARKKLSDFLKGKRSIEDTFDLKKFASFFAVLDLTYTTHALFFNSKMYYNPINGLFEPVPRDGHRQLPNYHKYNTNYYDKIILDSVFETETFAVLGGNLQIPEGRQWWVKKFFLKKDGTLNENFYSLYITQLKKISSQNYINSFLKKRANQIKKINAHIYSDYFFYSSSRGYTWGLYYFNKDDLFHRGKVIRKRLQTENKKISAIIDNNKHLIIDIIYPYSSHKFKKVKLDSLKIESLNCYNSKKETTEILINKKLNVYNNTKLDLSLSGLEKLTCTSIKVSDFILNKVYEIEINSLNSNTFFNDFKVFNQKIIDKYFIEKKDGLYLKSDNVIIKENIYIPKNKIVNLKAGQTLNIINNAFIISDSAWLAQGEKKNPILIKGEKKNLGGGILINDETNRSIFSNVIVSYLSGYNNNKFGVPNNEYLIFGAINFHQTDVYLSNILFKNIYSEDSINIIASTFFIENAEFIETISDSIDIDFSDGNIINSRFNNIGNDAIDFSGSNVNITNANFNNIGDKLISVGENSQVKIVNVKAKNSYAGISVKDGSVAIIEDVLMENVMFPFLSYNKKFEYKQAIAYLKDINISQFHERWLTDKSSKIYMNNKSIGKITKKIIPIIYEKDFSHLNTN